MDKVAVLLSSFNGEKYISCQIDSILNQQTKDLQIDLFVRDDGSSDDTINILEEYKKCHSNFYYYKGENIGFIKSFFELIFYVKSLGIYDFYSLSDQDDKWDNDKIQIGVSYIKGVPGPCLYESTVRITDENLNFKKNDIINKRPITFYNSAIQTISAGHTYIFNNSLMDLISENIDTSKIFVHDSFIHNLAVVCGSVFFDTTPHNDYRQHTKNVLGTNKNNGFLDWFKIRLSRVKKGDSHKYAIQIRYYLDYLSNFLSVEQKNELVMFFKKQKNFFTRLHYIFTTKFYRQSFLETFAFKILYLFGGYKPIEKK